MNKDSLPEQFVKDVETRVQKQYSDQIEGLRQKLLVFNTELLQVTVQRDLYREILYGILRARLGLKLRESSDSCCEET